VPSEALLLGPVGLLALDLAPDRSLVPRLERASLVGRERLGAAVQVVVVRPRSGLDES
jgi:hypothetical protein